MEKLHVFHMQSTGSSNSNMTITEATVGISSFANECISFSGVVKQICSDFIVREVHRDGTIARINDESFDQMVSESSVDEELLNAAKLSGYLSELLTLDCKESLRLLEFLKQCVNRDDSCSTYFTVPCPSRDIRTQAHNSVKNCLSKAIESDTVKIEGIQYLRLNARHKISTQRSRKRPRENPVPGSGEYLQFQLLKEGIDTISAVHHISRCTGVKHSAIGYAGVKDKRAVTVQWMTVHNCKASVLRQVTHPKGATICLGDLRYVNAPLHLGDLSGNRFEVTLREVSAGMDAVSSACDGLMANGFINYYGLQRFGSTGVGSHVIGRHILRCEWREAINTIYAQSTSDSKGVKEMKEKVSQGLYAEAMERCPQRGYLAERRVLEGLLRDDKDAFGALQRIPRSVRLMYIHATQSYFWNLAASHRISSYGSSNCVEGDLVILTDETAFSTTGADDGSSTRVVTVSQDDLKTNRFSIHDVVIPIVGSESLFPTNSTGCYLRKLLADWGIDHENIGTHPMFSIKGSYRNLIVHPREFHWKAVDRDVDSTPRDITALRRQGLQKRNKALEAVSLATASTLGPMFAVLLHFTLPPGSYATMLLRELLKFTNTPDGIPVENTDVNDSGNDDDML